MPTPSPSTDLARAAWRASPAGYGLRLVPRFQLWRHTALISREYVRCMTTPGDRLIINVQNQVGKSLTTSILGPDWMLDHWPHLRVMLICHGMEFAAKFGRRARNLVADNPDVFRRLEIVGGREAAAADWTTTEGGGMHSTSMDRVAGKPADRIQIDDPYAGWQEAHSETVRENVWTSWETDVQGRIRPETSVCLTMTRYHYDDLAGRLTDPKRNPEWRRWRVVRIPALAEDLDDPLGRRPGETIDERCRSRQFMLDRKATTSSYFWCTPAETPVLMADWSTKPISEVEVGDEVVGFVFEQGKKMRLQRSKVTGVGSKVATVVDLRMASGRTVRCTPDHRWFIRSRTDGQPNYREAKVGRSLRFVCPTDDEATPEELGLWGWLAGIVDGEGNVGESVLRLCQSLGRNEPVADRMLEVLDRLGLSYRSWDRPASVSAAAVGRHPERQINVGQVGGVYRKLLRLTHLAKRDQAIDALFAGAGRTLRHSDKVISIENPVTEPVFALETQTGNYVAWGYASSNSGMYQQRPAPLSGGIVKRSWWKRYTLRPGWQRFDELLASWDMAFKETDDSSFVVGQVWGRMGGDFYLLDQIRDRMDFPSTIVAVQNLANRWPMAAAKLVEDKANGPAVIATLARKIPGLIAVEVKGSKEARAHAVSPYIESGNVWIPADELAPWVGEFVEEWAAFPKGVNDDQVDASTQALDRLAANVGVQSDYTHEGGRR